MGFTSANNSNVNQSNGKYEINNLIFPSRHVFTTIKSIAKILDYFILLALLIVCGQQ